MLESMLMFRLALLSSLALSSLGIGAGCGLIDSNIADFDLSLPAKEISVDTADWMLVGETIVPAIDCSESAAICDAAVSQFCGNQSLCVGACDGQRCKADVAVNLFRSFDLAQEKPELREIDGKPLIDVTISRISYTVTENTMNVDSAPMGIYIGPQTAMTIDHAAAELIGTIPVIAAGQTVSSTDVELVADAKKVVGRYMREYSTPFNIIIGSTVELKAADILPTGKLVAVVEVRATAGF